MQTRALVDDCQMPEGVNWFIAQEEHGGQHLFVRRSLCVDDCGACPVLAEVARLAAAGQIPGPTVPAVA